MKDKLQQPYLKAISASQWQIPGSNSQAKHPLKSTPYMKLSF